VQDPRTLVKGYPSALADILLRALAKDPAARYQTAAELAKDLDAYVMTGGRIVNPATVLEIMTNLFPGERDRDASWFEHAELPIRTVPLAPLSLPSMELVSDASLVPKTLESAARVAAAEPTTVDAPPPAAPVALESAAPAPPDLTDPKNTPIEPSTGGPPAGVPSGALGLLSQGEIAMFAGLAILVLVAVATAVLTR
jgi:serine/threonine-protein kinase